MFSFFVPFFFLKNQIITWFFFLSSHWLFFLCSFLQALVPPQMQTLSSESSTFLVHKWMSRQMHWTNVPVSNEAKYWVSWLGLDFTEHEDELWQLPSIRLCVQYPLSQTRGYRTEGTAFCFSTGGRKANFRGVTSSAFMNPLCWKRDTQTSSKCTEEYYFIYAPVSEFTWC